MIDFLTELEEEDELEKKNADPNEKENNNEPVPSSSRRVVLRNKQNQRTLKMTRQVRFVLLVKKF